MKKLFISALILLSTLSVFAQSSDPFTTADRIDITGYGKWRKYQGQRDDSSSVQVVSNKIAGYDPLGSTYWGAAYFDSSLAGTDTLKVRFTFEQKSTTANDLVAYIMLTNAADSSALTTTGYALRVSTHTGTGNERLELRLVTGAGTEFSLTSFSPAVGNTNMEYVIGDTLQLERFPNGFLTIKTITASGTRDSVSVTNTTYNHATWKAGIRIKMSAQNTQLDNFRVYSSGGTSDPPPATELAPPILSGEAIAPSQLIAGVTNATGSVNCTDDSSGVQKITMDTSNNNSTWVRFDSTSYAARTLSSSFTSKTFTRSVRDTVWIRFIASDYAGKLDTSTTLVAYFIPQQTTTPSPVMSYIYMPSWNINFGPGTTANYGTMPVDSIDFTVGTYYSTFASGLSSNGLTVSWGNVIGERRKPLNDRAHAAGKPITLCLGGSGSDAWMTSAFSAANRANAINTILSLMRTYQYDGVDFDWEPYAQADSAIFYPFARILYDSLQAMTAYYDVTKKPLLILTFNPGGGSWGAALVPIQSKIDLFNLMSYDKIGSWTGETYYDCAVSARVNGVIVERVGSAEPATIESQGERLAGVDPTKIMVGIDVMGASAAGGAGMPGGGATGPHQTWTTAPSFNADYKFDAFYDDILDTISASLIRFDDTAGAYWVGLDKVLNGDDRFYSFMGMPGKDSSIARTIRLVQNKGWGGFIFWDLTEAYLGTARFPVATYPNLERNWAQNQLRKYLSGIVDTTKRPPAAPALVTPTNGATNQSLTPTLDWTNVTGGTKYWAQYDTVSFALARTAFFVEDSTLTVSQKVLSTLPNNKTIYWRAAGKNTDGWGVFSGEWSFITIPVVPGAPTLSSPADAATEQSQSITFVWIAPSTGGVVTNYRILVDNDVGFGSPYTDDSTLTTTSKLVVGLANSTVYYWKVGAKSYPGGWGVYPVTRSLTTGAAIPIVPTLISPINGASNQATSLQLSWNRPAGADSFQVQINNAADTTTLIKDTLTALNTYTVSGLSNATTYYWRVYSNGQAGNSPFSNWFQFTVGTSVQPTTQGNYLVYFDRTQGKYVSAGGSGFEVRNLSPSAYLIPVDSNNYMWGPKGYKDINGNVTLYSTSATNPGRKAIQDSLNLGIDTLESVYLKTVNMNSSFTMRSANDTTLTMTLHTQSQGSNADVILPAEPGIIARIAGDDLAPNSITPTNPITPAGGGTGANLDGTGGPSQVVLKTTSTGPMSVRQLTAADISGYSSPTGKNIIDSLNTNTRNDTLTTGLTLLGDTLWFINGTTVRGYVYAGSTSLILSSASSSTGGVTILDNNSGAYFVISGTENGGLFKTATATNNDHFEIQHRGTQTTRTDSAFQVSDSTGRGVFQVSNWGDLGLYTKATGVNTFTTTATADTVLITGAATTDRYFFDYTAAPNANDVMKWYTAKTDTVIFSRAASGTSGIGYTWLRIKVIP